MGECLHKIVFPPTSLELLGSLLILLLGGLANAGGLGGGALMIPILLIIFNYDSTKAVMTAYVIVFGGAFGNFIVVLNNKDPITHKVNINFDLASLCLPPLLVGTVFGVFTSKLSPEILIIGLLIIILLQTFIKSLKKYK